MNRAGLAIALGLVLISCQTQPAAAPTLYVAPGGTVTPIATQAPMAVARATSTPPCVNSASFLEDLTIPDGTSVSPGETLDKRWSVRNSGTCDWNAEYRLVRLDTGELGGQSELALYPARAGEEAVWQVELEAPNEPGDYLASWQARSPNGELFGDQVFVLVEVRR